MFCLNIALGSVVWRLLYKNEEKAIAAANELGITWERNDNSMLALNDEFGQTIRLRTNSISGVMTENLDQSKMGHVELALHQARTQALATKSAQADPALRANALMNGPAMLTPMSRQ